MRDGDMPQPRGFVPGVHAARALAACTVAAVHVFGMWTNLEQFNFPPWHAYTAVAGRLRFDDAAGAPAAVLLFFLVSGYIVSQASERDGRASFAVKRLVRIVPPMAIAVALTLIVHSVADAQGHSGPPGLDSTRAYSWHAVTEALGLAPSFGGIAILFVLWTIYVEYWWYALLAAFLPIAQRRPVVATWFMAATVLVGCFVASMTDTWPVPIPAGFVGFVFVMLVGRWIYLRTHGHVSTAYAVVGVGAMVAGWIAVLWREIPRELLLTGPTPRVLSLAWALLVFILLLRFVTGRLWRPVSFLADISYGIYLFHLPVMIAVLPIVSPGGRLFALGAALTLALIVVVSWASYRWVETPLRRLARRKFAADHHAGSADAHLVSA